MSADTADPRRHDLDAHHQRQGQEHAPQHREAELRARLRIGGDAARIVVGGTGDEAGAEMLQQVLAGGTHGGRPGTSGAGWPRVYARGRRHVVAPCRRVIAARVTRRRRAICGRRTMPRVRCASAWRSPRVTRRRRQDYFCAVWYERTALLRSSYSSHPLAQSACSFASCCCALSRLPVFRYSSPRYSCAPR